MTKFWQVVQLPPSTLLIFNTYHKPLQPRIPSGQKPKPPQTTINEAKPIAIPSNKDFIRPNPPPKPVVVDDESAAAINIDALVNANDQWEAPKAASEVEKELKELFSGTPIDHQVDFSDEDVIVDGFNPDFRLLPHQVQARRWMKDREEGTKHGGILADDMG
jgi:SNF2 family DNA or RNA helicase